MARKNDKGDADTSQAPVLRPSASLESKVQAARDSVAAALAKTSHIPQHALSSTHNEEPGPSPNPGGKPQLPEKPELRRYNLRSSTVVVYDDHTVRKDTPTNNQSAGRQPKDPKQPELLSPAPDAAAGGTASKPGKCKPPAQISDTVPDSSARNPYKLTAAGARYTSPRKAKRQSQQPSTKTKSNKMSGVNTSKPHGPTSRHKDPISFSIAPPQPTPLYTSHVSCAHSHLLPHPQRLLLILDLNGVLIYRKSGTSPRSFRPRPGLHQFLEHIFAHHAVMIWTSTRRENAFDILNHMLSDAQKAALLGVWTRENFGLTQKEFNQRTQVYKRLSWVWGDEWLNAEGMWGLGNTLLLDDSVLKGAAEPWNLLRVKEWAGEVGDDELRRVADLVDEAAMRSDVARWNYHRDKEVVMDGDVMEDVEAKASADQKEDAQAVHDVVKKMQDLAIEEEAKEHRPEAAGKL
ncbi:HAD-like protein [Myriangium duriaei CBS 260.36]|uniref:Mitochondrial import inner membrane translocase subunit TIM50 n=1 Tax=Myriangium duriaei CBS 260.36 TaxID=1168546 RepID=A0A9P4J4E1_9PEZI|nr:HAD-like protein [Myriangium duriaei CBS 260.36]